MFVELFIWWLTDKEEEEEEGADQPLCFDIHIVYLFC